MNHGDFYKTVYDQDNPRGAAHGWVQWKGTDVCIDLHCACGYLAHFDGDFLYYYECPECHAKYAVGQVVKLIPLTEEQAAFVQSGMGFKTESDYTPPAGEGGERG